MQASVFDKKLPSSHYGLESGSGHYYLLADAHNNIYTSTLSLRVPNPLFRMELPLPPVYFRTSQIFIVVRHPYLALIYRSPFFGRIMEQFLFINVTSVELSSFGWQLMPKHSRSWRKLENLLVMIVDKLEKFLTTRFGTPFSLWDRPDTPSFMGYDGVYPTQQLAYRKVRNAMHAFTVYTAYITFLGIVYQHHTHTTNYPELSDLFLKAGIKVHPKFVAGLIDSGIGTPTVQLRLRQGIVVDVHQSPWLDLVPYLIQQNAPIWFLWGRPPFLDVGQSWLSEYRPRSTLRGPWSLSLRPPSETIDPFNAALPRPADHTFPSVQPASSQRAGETMKEFFVRREQDNYVIYGKEKRFEKIRREKREKLYQDKRIPQKKGPRAFKWENVDGQRIRTAITRAQLDSAWQHYRPHQRKYDPFHDEFDCCSDFEDGVVEWGSANPYDNDDDEDFFSGHYEHASPSPPAELPTEVNNLLSSPSPSISTPAILQTPTAAYVNNLYEESKEDICMSFPVNTDMEPPLPPQFVEDLVFFRYGFVLNDPHVSNEHANPRFKNWIQLRRGIGAQDLDSKTSALRPVIMNFMNMLAKSENPLEEIPSAYWDLNPDNDHFIFKAFEQPCYQIEVKEFTCPGNQPAERLCILHPRDVRLEEEPSWRVAVSPRTALECIRHNQHLNTFATAEYLLSVGLDFRTLQRVSLSPPSIPSSSTDLTPLLGHRANDHVFDAADFGTYEALRNSYLRSHPNSRRLLTVGGILSHLAREVLPNDVVLAGPSQLALEGRGEVLMSGHEVYVDDSVPKQMSDLVSGAYLKSTQVPGQTSVTSWFPLDNTWANAGLNIGHWNAECEEWYTKRHHAIVDGNAQPLATGFWRTALRMTRGSAALSYRMHNAASQFIQLQVCSPWKSRCSPPTIIMTT